MWQDPDRHKFNSDLLASEEDRKRAESIWPSLIHILYHPELVQLFDYYSKTTP